MSWDGDCRTLIDYMQGRQKHAPQDELPTMAMMPAKMYAAFMGISEEEAVAWLEKHAQPQGGGLWLITAPPSDA